MVNLIVFVFLVYFPLYVLLTLLALIFIQLVQCDMLDMPAVGQLEKDAKYALVYQLLRIFLTQRLDAYLEFQATNSTFLKSLGKFYTIIYLFGI